MRRATIAFGMALLGSGAAWAQEEADPHRTAVSVVGGLSVGSSGAFGHFGLFGLDDSGARLAVGGGIAHDLSPRVTLEATGLYLDRGSSAWSADAGLRVNLAPSGQPIVPYFAASGGVYSERVETRVGSWVEEVATHAWRGLGPGGTARNFFGPMAGAPFFTDDGEVSRTDGMVTFGGGVRITSGGRVFVRPDARAQVVFGPDTRVLGLFTLNFGYRF